MTNNEILQQTVDKINIATPHKEDDFFLLYEHRIIQTKQYRDEGSATYKLIRLLEQATRGVEEIYWRFKPEVVSVKDFKFYYDKYRGMARFSFLKTPSNFNDNNKPIGYHAYTTESRTLTPIRSKLGYFKTWTKVLNA